MFSVIFDMDGTLLDTQRIWIPAWDHAGNLQGFKGMGAGIQRVCGMNDAGSTRYLEGNFPGLDVVTFKKDARDYVDKNLVVRFKDGAEELLDFLKRNNIKIALASGSSSDVIEHNLTQVGASDLFDVTVGGQEVKNGKPAPDIFLRVAERMGVDPETCFAFEDSVNGIKAGHAAGMKCIGVPDVVRFDEETKKLMFKELSSLSEAIELFEPYIK